MNSSPSLDAKLQVSIVEPPLSTSGGGANTNPIASKSTIDEGTLKQSLAQRRDSTEIGAGLILGLAAANASSDDRGDNPESAAESHTFRIWEERGVIKTSEGGERAGKSAGNGGKATDSDRNSNHSPSQGSSPGTNANLEPHATNPSLSSINVFQSHVPSDSGRRDSSCFLPPLLPSPRGVGQNHHSIRNLLNGNETSSNTPSTSSAASSLNFEKNSPSSDHPASAALSSPNTGRQTDNRFREGIGERISLNSGNPNPCLDSNANSDSNTSGNCSSNSANRRNECTFRNCNKDFARLHDLKRHLATVHGVNARIIRGVICDRVSSSSSSPTEEAGHERISPETLSGSSDPDVDGFNSIPSNSSSNSAFPFPQVFEFKSKSISHPNSHTDPPRNASASSPSSSTPNQILTATSPKKDSRHHCSFPECKSSFVHDKDLARHFKSHTEGKTHVCLECKKAFSRKDALRRHVKSGMEKGNKCAGSPFFYRSQDEFGGIERDERIYVEVPRDAGGNGNEDGFVDGNADTKATVNLNANGNVNRDAKGKGREEKARQLDAESGLDENYQEVVINLRDDLREEVDHHHIRNKQRNNPQEDENRHEKRKDQEGGNEIVSNPNDRSLIVCAHNQVPSSASSSPSAYSFPMSNLHQQQQKEEILKGSESHLRNSPLPSLNNSGKMSDSHVSNSPMDVMCSRETNSPHHDVGSHSDPHSHSHSHPSTSISNSRTNPRIYSESPDSRAIIFYCPYPGCSSFFKLPEQLGIHAQSHVSKSRFEAEMKIRGNQKDGIHLTDSNSNLVSSYAKSRTKGQGPVKRPFNQEEVRQGGSSSLHFSPLSSPSSTKISSARTQEHSFFLPPLKRFKTFSSIPSSSSSFGSNSYNELSLREPSMNHFRSLTSPSDSHLHSLSNPHSKHQSNHNWSEIRPLSFSSIDSLIQRNPTDLDDSQRGRFSPSKSPFERNQGDVEFNGKDSETEIQKRTEENEVNQHLFISSIEREDEQEEQNRDDEEDELELDTLEP